MATATAIREEYKVVSGKDDRRQFVFSLLVKRTYDIGAAQSLVRAQKARPIHLIDVYYPPADPATSSVQFENDMAPFKVATDVVVIGKVYAPGGKAVHQLDASIEVGAETGASHKTVRVIGDRKCIFQSGATPAFTEPVPFTTMDLRYERAYGGTDSKSIPDLPFPYPRNHLGTGFVLNNTAEVIEGLALPNFEDPEDLLTPDRIVVGEPERWSGQPLPQGFGWFQRTWYPRSSFVGAVPGFIEPDTPLREEALGLVPKGQIALARQFRLPSFDVRFNSGASAGLAVPFLKGGEPIRLTNLSAEGTLAFTLPADAPRMIMDIGFGERELAPFLQTVCFRAEERQVDLVWRGSHEFPGIDWLPEMTRLHVEVGGAQ